MTISIADNSTPEETTDATTSAAPEAASASTCEPSRGNAGLPAEDEAPSSAASPSKPSQGNMGLPIALVVLLVGGAGIGIFGATQFQDASSARGELSMLRGEVSALTTTIETLQTKNEYYQGVLTRVRAVTGTLQASLTELEQLATLPVVDGAASADVAESTSAVAGVNEVPAGSAPE